MFNLIITILAIGLFATILMAGHSYINFDIISAIKESNKISAALVKITSANAAYVMNNETYPVSLDDLIPVYTNEPLLPSGLSWNSLIFDKITGKTVFCFGGFVENNVFLALKNVQKDIGGAFVIGKECGDENNASFGNTFPLEVVVTYTVK